MRVQYSEEAKADLREIGAFIGQRSRYWSKRFLRELTYACRSLAHMPLRYPIIPEREDSGIRRRVYKGYLIFYRVEAEVVSIIHILNGARDYERVLFPDDELP
jgi:toxin ParE1/3/4